MRPQGTLSASISPRRRVAARSVFTRRGLTAAALLAAALSAACAPIVRTHGYTPRAAELDSLEAGVDTRASVQSKLGRPSTIGAFDDDRWYYISRTTETFAFFEPEVTNQIVVTVDFDGGGQVSEVGRYGLEDGRVINLVTRTTPTSGRELTILQQIFQNVGRFEGQQAGPLGNIGGGI